MFQYTDSYLRLIFRWLAIRWLQAELDAWMRCLNSSPRRADKHKLLPRGIPDLIHAKPHLYGSKDFKVVLDTYYSVQEFLIDAKGCCDT